jgi:hypothetical protein
MLDVDTILAKYQEALGRWPDGAPDDPYTDGALDALRWVVGDTDTDPFEVD